MSRGDRDAPVLTDEDRTLLAQFQAVRKALQGGDRLQVEDVLYGLERQTYERLSELQEQASHVADANARSVEIMASQEVLNEELKAQNVVLQEQKAKIEEVLQELEAQSRSIAEANVEAVLQAERSDREAGALSERKRELTTANRELFERAKELEEQATALASANAEAVAMMDERETEIGALSTKAKDLEVAARLLEEKAFMDSLTELFNHRYFKEQIEYEASRSLRYKRPLSLVFLDVDRFKNVNDTLGHQTGDQVLKSIGRLIKTTLRSADIPVRMPAKHVAARYGGEEFVVILPETPLDGAVVAAERLRAVIEEAELLADRNLPDGNVTVSGGVASMSGPGSGTEDLVRRADEALYRAKGAGRNRIEVAPEK